MLELQGESRNPGVIPNNKVALDFRSTKFLFPRPFDELVF